MCDKSIDRGPFGAGANLRRTVFGARTFQVLPAMFLGLIVPGLRTGREALAAVFGGALTLVGAGPLAVVAGALAFAAASSARPAAARS